jgi:hypothetical protein
MKCGLLIDIQRVYVRRTLDHLDGRQKKAPHLDMEKQGSASERTFSNQAQTDTGQGTHL